MYDYEQSLHISDDIFESMRQNTDMVLQKLVKDMVEKESFDGSVTIKIDIGLEQSFIPNFDPKVDGENRRALTPKISHKVGSVMQIKNEKKGDTNYEGMEVIWDPDKGEYVMRPIANTTQRTIFDADYVDVVEDEEYETEEAPALEGRIVAGLPGPIDDALSEEVINEVEDISDQVFDETDTYEDDYEYEEPEE